MKKFFLLLCILFIAGFTLFTTYDAARGISTGVSGLSGSNGVYCSACHNSGLVPGVTLVGPTVVDPGATYLYTLIISGGQQIAGGLDVAVTAGALTAVSPDTQIMSGEITHTEPKPADKDGAVSFTFQWTAPLTGTAVTMYGAGNSVDNNGSPSGDAANITTLAITVLQLDEKVYLPLVIGD